MARSSRKCTLHLHVILVVLISLTPFTCEANVDDESPHSYEIDTTMQTQYITQTSLVPVIELGQDNYDSTHIIKGKVPPTSDVPKPSSPRHPDGPKSSKWPSSIPTTHLETKSTVLSTPFDTSYQTPTTKHDMLTTIPPSDISSISTTQGTQSPTTQNVINACDIDQTLEVSTNPILLSTSTENYSLSQCNIMITSGNRSALSIKIRHSRIKTFYSYFYIELLGETCTRQYALVSHDSSLPCRMTISGNQFRFYFQKTDILLELHAEDEEMSRCVDQFTYEEEKCQLILYNNQAEQIQQNEHYTMESEWRAPNNCPTYDVSFKVTRYLINCDCECIQSACTCALGDREYHYTCRNKTSADLIVYKPNTEAISFSNAGLRYTQPNAINTLTSLKCLILNRNSITILPECLLQNLQHLEIVDLSKNHLTDLKPEMFHTLVTLRYLDLRNNIIYTLPKDVFDSLHNCVFHIYLSYNNLTTLSNGTFFSLDYIYGTLDMSHNNLTIGEISDYLKKRRDKRNTRQQIELQRR